MTFVVLLARVSDSYHSSFCSHLRRQLVAPASMSRLPVHTSSTRSYLKHHLSLAEHLGRLCAVQHASFPKLRRNRSPRWSQPRTLFRVCLRICWCMVYVSLTDNCRVFSLADENHWMGPLDIVPGYLFQALRYALFKFDPQLNALNGVNHNSVFTWVRLDDQITILVL